MAHLGRGYRPYSRRFGAISAPAPSVTEIEDTLTNSAASTQTILESIAEIVAQPDSILDNFNRANENPLVGDGNWDELNLFTSPFQITSNELQGGGTVSSGYWKRHISFTDVDVVVTIDTVGGANDDTIVVARIQQPGGTDTYDGYEFKWTPNGTFVLTRVDNALDTILASTTSMGTLSNGDKIKIRCLGTLIEGHVFRSGAWVKVLSAVDSTYTKGYVGVRQFNSTARLDDFTVAALSAGESGQTIAQALAETITNSASSSQTLTSEAIGNTLTNSGTGSQTLTGEAIGNALTNSSSGTQTILSAEAQSVNNSGTGSFTVADATSETISNSQSSSQTLLQALADTESNTGTGSQTILSAEAQAANNAGTSSFTTADSIAETHTNSANSNQTLLSAEAEATNNSGSTSHTVADATAETALQWNNEAYAYGGNGYGGGEYGSDYHTLIEVIVEAGDVLTNEVTGTQTILSAEAQAINESGVGSFTIADATAESTTSTGTGTLSLVEALAEIVLNVATAIHIILSALADTEGNTGSGTTTISDATAETTTNSNSSGQTQTEAEAQDIFNVGVNTPSITEDFVGNVEETLIVTGVSTHTFGIEATLETDSSVGTSTPVISTADAESTANSGSGTSTLSDATAEFITNVLVASQTISEALAEILSNSQTSSQTLVDLFADALVNSASSTITILSAEAQELNNSGLSSFVTADATAEELLNLMVAEITLINENITIVISEIIDAPGYHMEYEFVQA